MKKFTQVYNMISREWTGIASGMDRVKSRIHTFLPLFTIVLMLMVGAGNAWGATHTIKVGVGAGKGKAKVELWKSPIGGDSRVTYTDYVSAGEKPKSTQGDVFYTTDAYAKYYAEAADGYYFSGWYSSSSCTGTASGTTSPWSTSKKSSYTSKTFEYYAKFLPVTVSSAGSASAISFNHAETKTVTLYFPVSTNADSNDDFNKPTITANKVWTVKSWNLNTTTHKVEVVCEFAATADVEKGSYVATVTLKAKSNEQNTGIVTANVDLTPTLTYKNGSVDISVSDADKTIINVDTLRTAYKGADNVAGDGTITYSLKTANSNVSLTSAGIFYAKATGTYTIVASATKGRYYAKTAEFNVTVGKRTPTFSWWNDNGETHIYAGDTLRNVAQARYNNQDVDGLDYSYTSRNTTYVVVDGTNLRIPTTGFNTWKNVWVVVNTAENDWYEAAKDSIEYKIEPKKTARFYVNDQQIIGNDTTLYMLIGQTANMSFVEVDESNFVYTSSPKYVKYEHDSEQHDGVLTAKKFGDEDVIFHQKGTDTYFDVSRTVHVYVSKHAVSLSSTMGAGTWKVDSVYNGTLYSVTAPTGSMDSAMSAVSITAKSDTVLRYVDNHWKAVGAGKDTLIFAMPANGYWTGDTLKVEVNVEKYTPEFTWNLPETVNYNRAFTNPVSSTNTMEDCTFSYSSDKANVINWTNGALRTFEKGGTHVGVTVTQAGNYKWNAKTETFYVNVEKLMNHVELTVNKDAIYSAVLGDNDGAAYIQVDKDNGIIRLGGSSTGNLSEPAWNWDDKYVIINFEGVPDKLTFSYAKNVDKATGVSWYVQESADGNFGDDKLWTSTASYTSFNSVTKSLQPSTRYLKLCYHGNFAGYFKNVKITQRKEIYAAKDFSFGSAYVGNTATERTINVAWYNVNTCNVTLSGANSNCFELVDETVATSLDTYGNTGVRVKYKHETVGSHTATLTITSTDNPAKTATVTLSGTTDKALQDIIWREDITPLPLDEPYPGAAIATSGLAVTLTAETPGVVKIEGDIVTGVGVGTTRLFAYQAGDTKWEEVKDTILVEVTNKHVQHIIWNDKLSNIKREDGKTVTMKLTAYSDADNTLPITYELNSDASSFASVSGSTLTVTGWGTGYITARQAGTDHYVGVSKTVKIVSRDPDAGCDPLVLDEASEKTLHTIDSRTFSLSGEPAEIRFDAKCDWDALWGLWVAEYYDGEWHEVTQIMRTEGNNIVSYYKHFGPFNLTRRATAVKLYTEVGATMTRTFKNVEVSLAKYLELKENNMDFSAVEYGQVVDQQFIVDYSNITGVLDVKLKDASSQFKIITETLGEDCGDIDHNAVVRVRFTGKTKGVENNTIVISNKDQSIEIPVSATVILATQQITWNDANPAKVNTTDDVVMTATATSELPVSFVSSDNAIAEPYNKGDGTWGLTIKNEGTITITAKQAGNEDYYSAAPDVEHTYKISRVKPTITIAPTADAMTLPNTQLSGCTITGEASVEGSFAWEDESVYATLNNSGYTAIFTPKDNNIYDTLHCTVVVPVNKASQTIVWDFDELEMYCNADITFDAHSSTNLQTLPIRYETSDESIAYVDANNHLNIVRGAVEKVTITAYQDGDSIYAAAEPVSKELTIKRFKPTIVTKPTASSMMIGRVLSDASLANDGRAELNNTEVEGIFSWVNGNNITMSEAGTFRMDIVFTANSNYYEPVYDTLTVTVEKYQPTIENHLTASSIEFPDTLGASVIGGYVTAVDEIKDPVETVYGTYAWKDSSYIPRPGDHTVTALFIPNNKDWYKSVEVEVTIHVTGGYVFNGENTTWMEADNWAGNLIPTGENDPVLINENVEIKTEVTVGSLTIAENVDLVVKNGGVLTIGNDDSETRTAYGNLHVENGGQVILGAGELKVNDFTLEAKLGDAENVGMSGQILNPATLKVNGNAYFDLALDPSGECSRGWYDFTVPFPVDALNGVTRFRNSDGEERTITNEVNYAIMDFSESRRLETGYGWKKFRGVMQPGQCYTITIDDVDNVYRFKKTSDGSFNNTLSENLAYTETDNAVRGWNGLGNGTMSYINLSAENIEKVQVYSHSTNSYTAVQMNAYTYVVGSAYFVQAPELGSMMQYSHSGATHTLRAPQREAEGVTEFTLTLTEENATYAADRFYVSASEDAMNSYTIGRELTKFGNPTESKVAQVWTEAYGLKLCDVEMPLSNSTATCALNLFTPNAGQYMLSVEEAPENTMLYLTYNGRAIWNLTYSPYALDLTKGTTEGYGLKMYVQQVTTDIENGELLNGENAVRKVLIDDVIYIVTPEGKMYDITGKGVNY